MEKETPFNQASNTFKGEWTRVHIYAPTYAFPHICTGSIYCLPGRRLSDQLNELFPGTVPEAKEFLSVRDGEMYALRGEKRVVEFVHLSKVNILFVREFEDGQTRGIGSKLGYRRYPYVSKSSTAVKLLPAVLCADWLYALC